MSINLDGSISEDHPTTITPKAAPTPFVHPKSLSDFEKVYIDEYRMELEYCDKWIAWCKERNDYYGVNFHQGRRSAIVYNNIKMGQMIRIFNRQEPNVDHDNPNEVQVELMHFLKVLEYLARIERTPLKKIVWTLQGHRVHAKQQDMDDWQFTGLNNRDFIEMFMLPPDLKQQ